MPDTPTADGEEQRVLASEAESSAPDGSSGTVAGVNTERSIWKAPAGTTATIRGAKPAVKTNAENGVLNELGIDVLRAFAVFGSVVRGARTTDGADFEASQSKYVPVRRLTLHIENSLFEGSMWVCVGAERRAPLGADQIEPRHVHT